MRRGTERAHFEAFLWGMVWVCLAVLFVRWAFFGMRTYLFLGWNLVLALLPYALACAYEWCETRVGMWRGWLILLFVGWLFFFPNAPYIFTDYIHLDQLTEPNNWVFDAILIGLFAFTGVLFGLFSLSLMHETILRHFSRGWGWATVALVSLMSGYGVYLGRFARWNSWDIVTNPVHLMQDAIGRLSHPWQYTHLTTTTLLFAGFVFILYLVFRVLVAFVMQEEEV